MRYNRWQTKVGFFKKPQNLQAGSESSVKEINELTGHDLQFML